MLLSGVTSVDAAPPKVDYLFPAGGKRGSDCIVTANGEISTWPVRTWVDRPGVSVSAHAEKGKLSVAIDKDAAPGVYWVRLFDGQGASSSLPFVVDQLPEAEEVEPNDTNAKGQTIAMPVIVNGRLAKSGDVDIFAVSLKAGETLVASLRAHSLLGSPLDGVLQICELRERKFSSLAGASPQTDAYILEQNNDTFGLDPQVVFQAPRTATYLVRLFAFSAEPNSSINFAGGDNYIYRLTLTTTGLVEYALPDAITPDTIRVFGAGLPPEGVVGQRAAKSHASRAVAFAADIAGSTTVPNGASPSLARSGEAFPLVTDRHSIIAGELSAPGESHAYRLTAKKGQQVSLAVDARSLGLPLDCVLTVEDPADKVLQQIDDVEKKADPNLTFTAPSDGEYRIRVRDLHRRGGRGFAYWLHVIPTTPQFELSLAGETFVVAPGKSVEVAVSVTRKNGLKSDLEITAIGDNGAMPPGLSFASARSVAGDATAKAVKVVISAAADAPLGGCAIRIVGREVGVESPVYGTLPQVITFADPPAAAWLTVATP